MKHLKQILKKTYKKHFKFYDELEIFKDILKNKRQMLPDNFQQIAENIIPISFKNNVLTLSVSHRYFSPEINFFSHALKEFFNTYSKSNVGVVRFSCAPRNF